MISDIILNFLDGRLYEFFEWNSDDNFEHIKNIPLFKVESSVLEDFIFNKIKCSTNFLKKINNKTEVFASGIIKRIEYATILTDGNRAIAFEFSDKGEKLTISSLLLDEEEEILDLVTDMDIISIEYKILEREKEKLYTRKEQFIKNYIIQDLKAAYINKDYNKIKYLYEEIYHKSNKNIEKQYNKMITDINKNFNKNHFKIFHILKLINVK
ncbi:MAG: DUF3603 family protein [Bacilli bacterium]|nr:DUF3603 family protein [Bacilli bacterium]